MNRKRYAVILAGGHGERMAADVPKQFLNLAGKPILRHTVERFLEIEGGVEIIVVLPTEYKEYWKEYCRREGFLPRYILPSGGITRFHSVQNALQYVPEGALVAVHDGVRPLVTAEFLERLYEEAEEHKAVIPALHPVETVRQQGRGESSFLLDRNEILLVQTPQVFHSELLKKGYSQPYLPSFTDDASVVEAAGGKVKIVEGLRSNIKITTPADLKIAEALLD